MDEEPEKKSRRGRWGWEILLMVAVFAGVMMFQTWDHVGSGEAAPSFDLPQLGGGEAVSTQELRGKPTLIYFWAPWCGVCEASSHNVDAVHEAVGDEYNVLSVALEYSDVASVQSFVDRNDAKYPVLLGSSNVTADYAVGAFPTIYVLSADGEVVSSVVGYTTEIGIRARLWWANLRS